ncbi:Hypothetical protein POVN_LOCUS623 [uncultured virus]|nr:Hypothetical protein POVN_LOCUS623 [uncultured virus]
MIAGVLDVENFHKPKLLKIAAVNTLILVSFSQGLYEYDYHLTRFMSIDTGAQTFNLTMLLWTAAIYTIYIYGNRYVVSTLAFLYVLYYQPARSVIWCLSAYHGSLFVHVKGETVSVLVLTLCNLCIQYIFKLWTRAC